LARFQLCERLEILPPTFSGGVVRPRSHLVAKP
jgi:hypothetical protein